MCLGVESIKRLSLVVVVAALVVCATVPTSAFEIGQQFWTTKGGFASETDTVFEDGNRQFIVLSGSFLGIGPVSLALHAEFDRESDVGMFAKLISDSESVSDISDGSLLGDVSAKIRVRLPFTLFGIGAQAEAGYTLKAVGLVDAGAESGVLAYYYGPEFEAEVTKKIIAGLKLVVGARLAPSLEGHRKHGDFTNGEFSEVNVNATSSRYNIGLRYDLVLFSFEGGYMIKSFTESDATNPYSSNFQGWYFGGRFGF
jgi:hypothetical protein